MAATRRKKPAARRGKQGSPGWAWLLAGMLIGLGLAWYLFAKGYIPQPQIELDDQQDATAASDPGVGDEVAPATEQNRTSKYDFFTVLPEMEVYVPEQELSKESRQRPDQPATSADAESYLLQVGSFRSLADADKIKAQLALQGISAKVQTVTVNDTTWHRVRVGPVSGARETEQMRRRLTDNGFESMVLKNQ